MKNTSLFLMMAAMAMAVCAGTAQGVELAVIAGANPSEHCPVTLTLSPDEFWYTLSQGSWKLVRESEEIPLMAVKRDIPKYAYQLSPAGSGIAAIDRNYWELLFVVSGLKPFEKRVYSIEPGEAASADAVNIVRNDGSLKIDIGGKPFTDYLFATDEKQPRPIFYPLLGPNGARMTRGFPMDYHEGESKDHPHHHSLWVSHGDVNGVDFWMLGEKQGYQRHIEFSELQSNPAAGRIEELVAWTTNDNVKVMEERRCITIWGLPQGGRAIDFDLTFAATEGDVKFGDTKEGGLVSLRVAASIEVDSKKGGVIINANGDESHYDAATGKAVDGAWGKAAPWCDYSGPVDGETAGLTIMDYPENPFYPTYYHVRTYGLFTANPFGLSHFIDKSKDGSRTLKAGETWRCRYRVYIHAGDMESGKVKEAYANYADSPQAILIK